MRRIVLVKTLPEPFYSPTGMFRYLDRDAIAKRRETCKRTNIRKLCEPRLRKFALTLIEVMTAVPGPENLQAKKVCAANKINIRTYFRYLKICRKTIP